MSKAIAVPLDVAISSIFVQEEAVWRKTVKLLLKILGNILEKPEEAKFRKLPLAKIIPKVTRGGLGGSYVLSHAGFIKDATHLSLPLDADMGVVTSVMLQLTERQEEIDAERQLVVDAEAKYIAECNARSEERMRKRKLENEEREEREKAEKAKEEEERKVRQEKERKEREERERERKERAAPEPQEPLQTADDDDDDVEMQDMNAGNEVSSASTSPPGGLSVSREQSLDTTAADIAVDEKATSDSTASDLEGDAALLAEALGLSLNKNINASMAGGGAAVKLDAWTCPACTLNNGEGSKKCTACGAAHPNLPKSTPAAAGRVTQSQMLAGLSTEQKMEWLAQKKQEFKEKEIKKKQDQVKQSEKSRREIAKAASEMKERLERQRMADAVKKRKKEEKERRAARRAIKAKIAAHKKQKKKDQQGSLQ